MPNQAESDLPRLRSAGLRPGSFPQPLKIHAHSSFFIRQATGYGKLRLVAAWKIVPTPDQTKPELMMNDPLRQLPPANPSTRKSYIVYRKSKPSLPKLYCTPPALI